MTPRADAARIERDLRQLVAIPSVTGEEHTVQGVVASLLSQSGIAVDRLDIALEDIAEEAGFPGTEVERRSLPIVIGRIEGRSPGPTLMLQGHVDVVPPGDGDAWTSAPFAPEVRHGSLYGRGACDMKGGVVASLEAMRMMAGRDLEGTVLFVTVPSEEDGGAGAYAAIRGGLTADMCVITEPTDLDVVVAHGGAITFTLDVPGKAAHASVRREGVSALDNLTYLKDALVGDEQRRNDAERHPMMAALGLPYPTIIGQVAGGDWASTVMDRVVAHGRYGVTLGQDGVGAERDLRAAIDSAAASHPFLAGNPPDVTVWGGRFDSSSIDVEHPLPRAIQKASAAAGYSTPALVGAPYGADMRLYINQGNTPTVMYGPGDVVFAHAADEHVPLADVVECAEVLAEWIGSTLG